jgi:hypothetical protein
MRKTSRPDLRRRTDFRRQEIADLVVKEISLLLADIDQLLDAVVVFFFKTPG